MWLARHLLRRLSDWRCLLLVAWAVHYLHSVRRVHLHLAKTTLCDARKRMERIIERCPSLQMRYWPTWYAHTAFQQLLLLGLKELRSALQLRFYKRQILTLRDTQHISLDWVVPPREKELLDGPVCVLLHGAIQDSRSATMKDLAQELASKGLRTLVMNRRGYGDQRLVPETARVTLFGFDEDLDEVLLEVNRVAPQRPIALIGFSCGSGFAGRYGALRSHLSAWEEKKSRCKSIPSLLCIVAYDGGYDVVRAVTKVPWPYSWGLDLAFRYQYVFRHRDAWRRKSASSAEVVEMVLDPARSFKDVYRNVTKLSGFGCSNTWLEKQQPVLEDMQVPCLLINSRDDPICVWENVEEHAAMIELNPHLALADLQCGSHGCKFDLWGWSSVGNRMISDFVLASWAEWRQS